MVIGYVVMLVSLYAIFYVGSKIVYYWEDYWFMFPTVILSTLIGIGFIIWGVSLTCR